MLATLTCRRLKDAAAIRQMRDDYLRVLVAPMDGMWASTVIASAACWEIYDREQHAGYFYLGSDNELLRFHVDAPYQALAQAIFRWLIATYDIKHAIADTIEPAYFALCLDNQQRVAVQSYLFRDHQRLALSSGLGNGVFRQATQDELDDITRFYRANIAGASDWVEAFLRERLSREELFAVFDHETLVATGECIPSQEQSPYADLGMVVAHAYRGRGLGSYMLTQLKQHCYAAGWQPICSCVADNLASKRAIEKAGFTSVHRMVKFDFPQREL